MLSKIKAAVAVRTTMWKRQERIFTGPEFSLRINRTPASETQEA
jgi:hypothetical protein